MDSMISDLEIDTSAFVGISFSNRVIYNLVDRDGEFENTGLSIITFLKNDKNRFMANLIESQSYESIKLIFDDKFIFNELYSKQNENVESFNNVYSFIGEMNSIEYFYIYDAIEDVLIVKTPYLDEPIALDYKNSEDVRNFINN